MTVHTQRIPFGQEDLILEHGRLAKQADASVLATIGGTVVLVSAVTDKRGSEGLDFFPLTVDYREKFYAAGKFPGGFFKREARPGDLETLRARIIDRSIRPLFADGFSNDTQVYVVVLSFDGVNAAEMAALTAASAALNIARDIPFSTPLAGVRVAEVNGQLVLNPTLEQLENVTLDLVVAGHKDAINMVEAGSLEISEERMVEALLFAHDNIKKAIAAQEEFIRACATEKAPYAAPQPDPELVAAVEKESASRFPALKDVHPKLEREAKYRGIKLEIQAALAERFPEQGKAISEAVSSAHKKFARRQILAEERRADGRGLKDIRPIVGDVSVLPKTHGSSVFTRGETQSLAVVTLGTIGDQQKLDNMVGISHKRFMLHYNFPNFSVGETGRISGPGRREIGHGSLAERALTPVIPESEKFPYTIRIVSEILESNGSSSMATVCAGSLALMDAGVPVSKPVAGVAMGLIEEDGKKVILTDILGLEDHLGDMDFKVAGTEDGITALQMDIKIGGVTGELLSEALGRAKTARLHILGEMAKTMDKARPEIAPHAPRIEVLHISKDKIKDVIGPGGKTIRGITEETNSKIDIEEDGTIYVATADGESMRMAIEMIKQLTAEVEIGEVYTGKVVRVTDFGAFVEILPNREGLVHISELEVTRVDKVEDVCREGDMLTVKVINIDEIGRIRLSRKALLDPDYDEKRAAAPPPRSGGGDRDRGRGGGGRGGDRGGGRGGDRGGRGR